jgi:hypothetical protein
MWRRSKKNRKQEKSRGKKGGNKTQIADLANQGPAKECGWYGLGGEK